MRVLNLIKAIPLYSLFLISSCSSSNRFEFKIEYPQGIKVNKDSTSTFYLKVINLNNNYLSFTNIKTSCQCVVLSKKKLVIEPKAIDSIKIKLFGSSYGENTQNVIFSNDTLKKFRLINIRYEVTN
jgi:hypothetical protein